MKDSQILDAPIARSPDVGEHKFLQTSPPKWMHLGIQNYLSWGKVSAVDVPEDFHVFMPSLVGFYEVEQVEVTEHGLNALTELMVHEGKSISSDPLGYC